MNVIEAAKLAGFTWVDDYIISGTFGNPKPDLPTLERFAQIIRNQALEDAAKCCDELKPTNHYYERYGSDWATGTLDCCEAIRSMKKDPQ